MPRILRTSALIASALALVLVGCGDDGDDATATTPDLSGGDIDVSDMDESGIDVSELDDASGVSSADGGTATVTVDGTTYEFTLNFCQSVMGGLAGNGRSDDGEARVTISLPPADEDEELLDVPSVAVETTEFRWEADENLREVFSTVEPGQSEVTAFELDGMAGSGTARFVDTFSMGGANGERESIEGSFEIDCS